ncbi:hypothetical protein GA0115255_100952 [Streptomyces sp. Ncost-T6T-2b]|nr:hypothetical protein GA0115255_100952 [Streptomyces sp. Ncost-T6T-2b]
MTTVQTVGRSAERSRQSLAHSRSATRRYTRPRVTGRHQARPDPGHQPEVPVAHRAEQARGVRGRIERVAGRGHEEVLAGSGPAGQDAVRVGPAPVGARRVQGEGEAVQAQAHARRPSTRRGRPSGLSSRSSAGRSVSGVDWYVTGRSQRSIAVAPTEVEADVVAG